MDEKKKINKVTLIDLDEFKTNLLDMKSINSDKVKKI